MNTSAEEVDSNSDESDDDVAEDLSKFTVVQLKEMLREASLPVSGKKQELIDRLNDNKAAADTPTTLPATLPATPLNDHDELQLF